MIGHTLPLFFEWTFYEFFAGAGLARLGLEPHWTCVWANDIDHKKGEVYKTQFGPDELVVKDISEVSSSSLPPNTDLAWASFPCQDLSLAGWQRGIAAPRSGTFWAFWRHLKELYGVDDRPPIVVIENVMGLVYGDDFTGMCEALAALGLNFGAIVINARWFLPHSRPRVFIVAVDTRLDCDHLLESEPRGKPWFPESILKAYGSLPNHLKTMWRWWKLPPILGDPPNIGDLVDRSADSVEWHRQEDTLRLLEMMDVRNQAKVKRAQESRTRKIGFVYRRTRAGRQRAEIRFDGIAGCLRTPQGGSSRQSILVVDNREIHSRLLTPREASRLMGVPQSYWLPPNYNDAYRAMGDGVAVPAVRWLSENLLIPLVRTSTRSGEAHIGRHNGRQSQIAMYAASAGARADEWFAARS